MMVSDSCTRLVALFSFLLWNYDIEEVARYNLILLPWYRAVTRLKIWVSLLAGTVGLGRVALSRPHICEKVPPDVVDFNLKSDNTDGHCVCSINFFPFKVCFIEEQFAYNKIKQLQLFHRMSFDRCVQFGSLY